MLRSLFAAAGLALACAGVGVFTAIGVWVWSLKAEVRTQADYLAEKAEAAAAAADHAVGFVREVADKAEGELTLARAATAAAPIPEINPLLTLTARKASQDLAGSVERAHGAVVTASDAVVVADAALEVFNDSPSLKRMFGVNPEQVEATRSALGTVGFELRQARSVLGVPVPSTGEAATPEQLDAVDRALGQVRSFTNATEQIIATARQRVAETRQGVDVWSRRVAISTTLVCAIGVAGQFFMARFFWRTLRRRPA